MSLPNERIILLGEGVSCAEIASVTRTLGPGEILELQLELTILEATRCDQAYINIIDRASTVHAQIIVNELSGASLRPGISIITFRIGPLYLSNGSFEGHVIMWTSGGKKTMVQMRHAFEFDYIGPISLGPVYYPPAQVTVVHRDAVAISHNVMALARTQSID